ncbi:MAG TPA: RNA polymerase sigma factor [Steroidobacteraceae bacterium]|nr:RNA polymerase sigma factor [Steroidobacteraceae bacterium]
MEEALTNPRASRSQNERIAQAFSDHQGRLRAFVRRQVDDVRDADEIVQDVFYELVLAYRLLQPIEHLTAWMLRIARNRIIDRFRARATERKVVVSRASAEGEPADAEHILERLELPDDTGPETDYIRTLLADELEQAIAELPREQREVFIAHELEGRSFKELATATNTGINTLLGRKHAAVLYLRRRLRDAYEDFDQ